jgi:hypothetical protein
MFKMRYGSGNADQACIYSPGNGKYPNNWTYKAKMKITQGASWHVFGLFFGEDSNAGSNYLFDVSPGDKYWSLWKQTLYSAWVIYGWTYCSSINTTDWNTLKIVANGNTFTFYINGVQVYQKTISGVPTKGRVGLWTWRYGSNNETSFDDVGLTLNGAPIEPIAPGKLGENDFSEGQTGFHRAFPPGKIKK